MTPQLELEALGWCASVYAKIEFIADSGWADPTPGGSVLVRLEVLGFHPVIGRTLAGAVNHLQHQIDARDEAQRVAQERRRK